MKKISKSKAKTREITANGALFMSNPKAFMMGPKTMLNTPWDMKKSTAEWTFLKLLGNFNLRIVFFKKLWLHSLTYRTFDTFSELPEGNIKFSSNFGLFWNFLIFQFRELCRWRHIRQQRRRTRWLLRLSSSVPILVFFEMLFCVQFFCWILQDTFRSKTLLLQLPHHGYMSGKNQSNLQIQKLHFR